MNKSECIKHVVFECAMNVLSWDVAIKLKRTNRARCNFNIQHAAYNIAIIILYNALGFYFMSMGIVGVNSTAGREVKFIDPSKTTKSESSWLGYTLCDCII